LIGRAQIRLLCELVGVSYAGSEIGGQEDRERYVGSEKAGRYAGGVLGAGRRQRRGTAFCTRQSGFAGPRSIRVDYVFKASR
jgi:hypothetical protein